MSWRWLSSCLPMASGEWALCSALLTHTALALLRKLSLCQPMSFLCFTLSILSPIPLGASGCVGIICPRSLNCDGNSMCHALRDRDGAETVSYLTQKMIGKLHKLEQILDIQWCYCVFSPFVASQEKAVFRAFCAFLLGMTACFSLFAVVVLYTHNTYSVCIP